MDDAPDDLLLAAAAAGDVAGIHAAIAAGANVNARDDDGRTGLLNRHAGTPTRGVPGSIHAEADVDLQDDRLDNPFLYAGAEGILDILKLANEAGADPAITNRYGGVALIPASERGHVETVRYLLSESDVDVDHVNRLGWTALLEAILLSDGGPRHQEIVGLLIDAGADTRPRGQGRCQAALARQGAGSARDRRDPRGRWGDWLSRSERTLGGDARPKVHHFSADVGQQGRAHPGQEAVRLDHR